MFILFWPLGPSSCFTHLYSCFRSIVVGSDICTYPMRCNMFHHEDTDLWEGRDRLLGKINWKRFWKRSISPQLSAKTEAGVFGPFEKKWVTAWERSSWRERQLGKKNWERKTEKAMEKGHTGCFQHVPKRSWKIGNWQKPFPLCGQGCNALWA